MEVNAEGGTDKTQHAGTSRRGEVERKRKEKKKCGKVFVGADILWVLEGKFGELQGDATELF